MTKESTNRPALMLMVNNEVAQGFSSFTNSTNIMLLFKHLFVGLNRQSIQAPKVTSALCLRMTKTALTLRLATFLWITHSVRISFSKGSGPLDKDLP